MRTLFIPLVLIFVACLLGCAHYLKKPEYYRGKAREAVAKMPRVFNEKAVSELIDHCSDEKCIDDFKVQKIAEINLAYRHADQKDVENVFHAERQNVLEQNKKSISDWDENPVLYDAVVSIEYYETLARISQELGLANHWHSKALAKYQRDLAGWQAFANSLNQASTNLRLQQLEQRQRNTQWELDHQRRQNNQNYNGPVKVIGGY